MHSAVTPSTAHPTPALLLSTAEVGVTPVAWRPYASLARSVDAESQPSSLSPSVLLLSVLLPWYRSLMSSHGAPRWVAHVGYPLSVAGVQVSPGVG